MPPPATASGTRTTRATTPGATPKAKDDQTKATDMAVKDVATAIEYLVNGDLKCEDDELSFEYLSIIAMQLSQQPKLSAKKASEAFKALSYLILELHRKGTVEAVTDAIAKAISLATKRVKEEMEEATELIASAAATSNNTAEELREDKSLRHTQSIQRTGSKPPLISASLSGIGHRTPSLLIRLSRKSKLPSPVKMGTKSQSTIHCNITVFIPLTHPSRILTAVGRRPSGSRRAKIPVLPTMSRCSRSTFTY
jgi:hypothetical protein